ncbi:MAG: hypothetical protein PUC23_03460 [bacterium]|nr:hypothetical protein [bacterium]
MIDGLFIASIVGSCVQFIKEKLENTIPAENWANKELYYKDILDNVPIEQRMKNLQNGKYRMTETYSEPHRKPDGRIIIENCLLYKSDLEVYGAVQTMEWVRQGKYNLSDEELKKEEMRIKKKNEYLFSL